MQDITRLLEKGQESAHQIRNFLDERLGLKLEDQQALDHHSLMTLNSLETVLSILKSCDFDQDDEILFKKRKSFDIDAPDRCNSEDIGGGATLVPKEKRGCYKRRRTGQSCIMEVTSLIDDGHAWRKYGQKGILNTNYPRNYYRCTHKHDQGCQATKQVQQISENPTKYKLIYHGHHTCKSPLKTPSIIIDDSLEENSSLFLSFETNNNPKHALNPSMFPSSAFPTMVKQEYTSIKEETPSAPHDHSGAHNQYSSSSDNCQPSSSDLTSTGIPLTPASDQGDVISSAEFFPSAASPYDMDGNDLINLITLDQYESFDGLWD